MAHTLQERYSALVDEKLRNTLVTVDQYIFNNRYEGDPKAGAVKIPVRNTEAVVSDYNKATGASLNTSATTYITLSIDKDKVVNELIDGFDAAAVPDGIVAERLDSAGYGLALDMDTTSISVLEKATGAVVNGTKTAATESTAYKLLLAATTAQTEAGVPMTGRWAIVSPSFHALLLQDSNFIRQSDISQELLQAGAVGMCAGYPIFVSNNLAKADTTIVSGKKTTTEFICGHPNWCHRVQEWAVPVHVQDLAGSGSFIGASAVQGRKVYGATVSKPETLYIKRIEATV